MTHHRKHLAKTLLALSLASGVFTPLTSINATAPKDDQTQSFEQENLEKSSFREEDSFAQGEESSFDADDVSSEADGDSEGQDDSFESSISPAQNETDFETDEDSLSGEESFASRDEQDDAELENGVKTVWLYRVYNPHTGEHFYTLSATERDALVRAGWKDEGKAWKAPQSGVPIYRLYNPNASDHHYTPNEKEKNALVKLGWKDEGVAFHGHNAYGRAVYRVYNPNAKSGSHHYTLSRKERDALVKKGWKDEGSSFFAISDYTFFEDEETGKMRCTDPDGNEIKGRILIYDDWYDFGDDGLMKTGWDERDNGTRRWYDNYWRQAFGLTKIEDGWYLLDGETGETLIDALKTMPDGKEFCFDETGRAITGRVFAYPRVGQSDGEGTIVWNDFGWTDNPNRHLLLAKQAELNEQAAALKEEGAWDEKTEDENVQNVMAQLHRVNSLLDAQKYVEIHSVYNPNSGEHLYTPDSDEIAGLVKLGWRDEGVRFLQPETSNAPVYRVYSPSRGEHHYTMNRNEVRSLAKHGWKDEGISFYSAGVSKIEVYRLYNPNAKVGSHHYTLSPKERDVLVSLGWKDEGHGFDSLGLYSIVEEETEHGTGKRMYDPQDNLVSGLVDVQGYRYFFNPDRSDLMTTGEAVLSHEGKQIRVRFDDEGRMIFGEYSTKDGVMFYDMGSGEQVKGRFVQYGNPRKVCYYDENGYRVSGRRTIQGKTYMFNTSTGALMPDYQDLKNQVQALIDRNTYGGEQVAFALRVPGTEHSIILNSRSQQSASVMKAFVMGAIHERYDYYASRVGANYIEQQLSVMIRISDNNAWVNLVTVLGDGDYTRGRNVLRDWNRAHGYMDTWMAGVPYGNYTSAADASKLLCDIQEGKLKHSAKMKALLRTQAVPGRMLQGLPPEAITGNKPGWVPRCENDTVLVDAPFGTYVVTLLCDNMQSTERAKNLMAQLSPMVYNWMKANMNTGNSIPH